MSGDKDQLHNRMEALEARLAKARKEMQELDPERRQGLGALVEAISEQLDAYESGDGR